MALGPPWFSATEAHLDFLLGLRVPAGPEKNAECDSTEATEDLQKEDHQRLSGLPHRLQEQQNKARCENDGHGVGAHGDQTHDAPEHDVDEVVTTGKKIHGPQYALGPLGLQWVAMPWGCWVYNESRPSLDSSFPPSTFLRASAR